VFFDRDWSGDRTTADTTRGGLEVSLLPLNVATPIASDTTNAQGVVGFPGLDPGYYRIRLDNALLGDTLAAEATPSIDTVRAAGTTVDVRVSVAPPVSTIGGVRNGIQGRTVVVPAVITAGGQRYGDHSTFIEDTTGALRLRHVSNLDGRDYNNPGESVRVRGRIAIYNEEVVLDSARIYLAGNVNGLPPDTLSTSAAASAAGGAADAGLVQILNATIVDTATVGGVFLAGVDDGSGRLVVRLDPLLFAPTTSFAPGAKLDAVGPLAAMGGGVWQLWPRDNGDYRLY
jgi:hypothetical protein